MYDEGGGEEDVEGVGAGGSKCEVVRFGGIGVCSIALALGRLGLGKVIWISGFVGWHSTMHVHLTVD